MEQSGICTVHLQCSYNIASTNLLPNKHYTFHSLYLEIQTLILPNVPFVVQSDLLLPRLLIRVHVCYCTACFLSSLINKQEPLHVTLLSYALSSLLCVIRHVGYKTSWHGGSAGRRRICWTSWGHTSRIDSRCWHGQRKKQTKHSFSRNVGLPAREVKLPSIWLYDWMVRWHTNPLRVILTYIPPILMSCRSSAKEVRLQGKASGRRSSSNQQEKWTRCLQPHQPFLSFFAAGCVSIRGWHHRWYCSLFVFRVPRFVMRLLLGRRHSRPN